ncbi:MAG: hypothetical protein QM528_06730 [Phycisphaerales bacterium]|nr:hypothetical protein [Phycisphaerales bacterium]
MKQKSTSLGVFMSRQEIKVHEMKKITGGSCSACFSALIGVCGGGCAAGAGCLCYIPCCDNS